MTNCADFDLCGDDDSWILWLWCYYRNGGVVEYDNNYVYVDVNGDGFDESPTSHFSPTAWHMFYLFSYVTVLLLNVNYIPFLKYTTIGTCFYCTLLYNTFYWLISVISRTSQDNFPRHTKASWFELINFNAKPCFWVSHFVTLYVTKDDINVRVCFVCVSCVYLCAFLHDYECASAVVNIFHTIVHPCWMYLVRN